MKGAMSPEFHSQFGEDRWIEENLKPAVGNFCEIGAYDGVASSNTLHFEKLGWSGLCVEAVPRLAAQCQANRKCLVWCCAAGPLAFSRFYLNPNDAGAGGLSRAGVPIPVICAPLSDLIFHSGFERIDLLSIDTEGTELEVWRTVGLYRPAIVILEYRVFDEPPTDQAVVSTMTSYGYREVHRTHCNLIFTR